MGEHRRKPTIRLATGLLLLTASLFWAQTLGAWAEPVIYVNSRFGTSVTYPDEIFTEPMPLPENRDGMTWRAADGASLAVFGAYNVLELTPADIADQESKSDSPTYEVTYRRVAEDWVVVSGTDGDAIFYKRYEFGAADIIHSLILTYPASARSTYDRLVGRIGESLYGP
jgi:hypothetical protein